MAGFGRFPRAHEFVDAASGSGAAASGGAPMPAAYVPPLLQLAGIHQNAASDTHGLAWPSRKAWTRVATAATVCIAGVALWKLWRHAFAQTKSETDERQEHVHAQQCRDDGKGAAGHTTAHGANATQETRQTACVDSETLTAQAQRRQRRPSPGGCGAGDDRHAQQPPSHQRSNARKRSRRRRRRRASAATNKHGNNNSNSKAQNNDGSIRSSNKGGGGGFEDIVPSKPSTRKSASNTALGKNSSNNSGRDGHGPRHQLRQKSTNEGGKAQREQDSPRGRVQNAEWRAGEVDNATFVHGDRGRSPSSDTSNTSTSDPGTSVDSSPRMRDEARSRRGDGGGGDGASSSVADAPADAAAPATKPAKRKSKLPSWAAAWLRRSESQPNMATGGTSDTARAGSGGSTAASTSPAGSDEWPFWHWRKWRGGSVRARGSGGGDGGSRADDAATAAAAAADTPGIDSGDEEEVLGLLQNSPLPSRQDLRSMLQAWASQGDLNSTVATDGSSRSSVYGADEREDAPHRNTNDSVNSSRGATDNATASADDTWGGLRLRSRATGIQATAAAARSGAGGADAKAGRPTYGGETARMNGDAAQAPDAATPDIITFDSDDNEENESDDDSTSSGIQPWMRMALHAQELAQQGDEATSSLFEEAAKLMLLFQQPPGDALSPTPSSQMLLSLLGQGAEGEQDTASGTDSDDPSAGVPPARLGGDSHGVEHDDGGGSESGSEEPYDEAQLQQMAASLLGQVQPMAVAARGDDACDAGGLDAAAVRGAGEVHDGGTGVGAGIDEEQHMPSGRSRHPQQQHPLSSMFDDAVQHEEIDED